MNERITLLPPAAPRPDLKRASGLPPDLMEQVRARVRLFALLVVAGFALGPVIVGGIALAATLLGDQMPQRFWESARFLWLHVVPITLSAVLWWRARDPHAPAEGLLTLGQAYEVAICFTIGIVAYWGDYRMLATLPEMTWIPGIVILFPLIMPGPPRRLLWGAMAAAAMSPVSMGVLDVFGAIETTADTYLQSVLNPGLAVVFAYLGARTVHGLGKEVVEARQLGSYHLEERLGAGGMGEVWRARHRMLARPAAIKLIRPEVLGTNPGGPEVAQRRFEREAQATAGLRSPHTVELYDFGVATDGTFYYVMELLHGIDAATLVERFGPVPAPRTVFLLRQICRSLSEAHANGLVHRDIKPANIHVSRYGEEFDFVKVLDFGLVKGSDGDESPVHLTSENMVGGTPAFIAPEQALGMTDLDGRVDLYALGCTAYWMLTGQLVFQGATPMALLAQHINAAPVPVSQRTEIAVPASLERIVMSCLEKERERRPASARALLAQLDRVECEREWTQDHARAWWEAHVPLGERTPMIAAGE
ncbi:MAG TPA: serine/threonine-protein kinase [Gemmatimonadales bacterium]